MIDRIIIAEDKIKANLKRAVDGSTVQPCPVCLGIL